jgi:multiple antibiotic resistance protein
MPDIMQMFTFFILMLGPFKILGPFTRMTKDADQALVHRLAFRATLFSSITLILAGLIGEGILSKYGIPFPILGIAGGIILFLVALLNILHQFSPIEDQEGPSKPLTLRMAVNPLTFPTIVTPYGIAAVIVAVAMCTDFRSKLIVLSLVLVIMALNLLFMLTNRYTFKVMSVILPVLGAILGVVQVALGLMIIYNQFNVLQSL